MAKKEKTKGFWRTMFAALKEAKLKYKIRMQEELDKKRLLSSKSDWSMIETFIKQINTDPSLKVKITLNDGTEIFMTTHEERKKRDFELLDI